MKKMTLLLVFLLLSVAPAWAQTDDELIRAIFVRSDAAFTAGDADAVLADYADSAIRLGADQPTGEGIEAARADLGEFFAENVVMAVSEVHRVEVSGDLVHDA